MDERNEQALEKDLDPIAKDCEGNVTLKDNSSEDQENQMFRENSGEADILDIKAVVEPNVISSNGIDVNMKAIDENRTSVDISRISCDEAFDLEPIQRNDLSSSQENVEAVVCDTANSQTGGVSASAYDHCENAAECGEQSACSSSKEDKSEVNNSLVIDNEECNEKKLLSSDMHNHKVAVEEDSEPVSQLQKDSFIQNTSSSEKNNESNRESESMPYPEKEANLDYEVSTLSSASEDVSRPKVKSRNDVFQSDSCDKGSATEILNPEPENNSEKYMSCVNEKYKSHEENQNAFQEPLTSISENKDSFPSNSSPQENRNLNDDIGECKNVSSKNQGVTDSSEENCIDQLIEPQEISNKSECVHNKNLELNSKNNYSDQSDEAVPTKCDSLNSQAERNEIFSAEIVNCSDESTMELGENEKDAEINNIDIDVSDDGDKKNEADIEEMDIDKSGECENVVKDGDRKDENNDFKDQYMMEETEAEKQMLPVDENEALIQPGGSEEETITGDTENEGRLNETRGKDAEICIIPDDVTPRLQIPLYSDKEKSDENAKEKKKDAVAGTENVQVLNSTSTDLEPSQEADEEKMEDEPSGKGRPVRSAAKLAGNKIKSLVQCDFANETAATKIGGSTDEDGKSDESRNSCARCRKVKACKFEVIQGGNTLQLCSDQCYNEYLKGPQTEVVDIEPGTHVRKCARCNAQVVGDENTLSWETMDFCNEECLGKYQTELGSNCANCKGSVASVSLGKYCVRFGYDVKQFCSSTCLEEYKKGLKVCSYCQKDISTGAEGFLAPVGDKGQFKDFCTQSCMEKYEQMSNSAPPPNVVAECAVCSNSKPVKIEVELDNKTQKLCSEPCFAAFKFVNNITEGQCDMCKKYFDKLKTGNFSIYYEDAPHSFCCKTCMNVYILANRKIVPCNWCKVKKYNFDMIKKVGLTGQALMMCSLNCFTLYQVSVNAVSTRRIMCDFCLTFAQAKYHLTMSDASVRNFCCYTCVMSFQNQYPKQALSLPSTERSLSPIPTGGPKKILPRRSQVATPGVPVISSVQSLASANGPVSATRVSIPASEVGLVSQVASISQPITIQPTVPEMSTPPAPQVYQQIITKPPPVKQQKNKSILCKPYSHTKGVSCRPHPCMKETQTDESLNRKFLIPIPVPIFVPAPMHMYASPFPVAVPFPLPVPVPIFIPTTRNSAKGILKEIKKIQEKIPTDPFEAELLMMAEMVAGEKKQDPTDSESEDGDGGDDGGDGTFSPENVDTSNTFGEDMLQMALKMATELEEPAVDMESVLTSNTITPTSQPTVDPNKGLYGTDDPDQVQVLPMSRGRKRSMRGSRNSSGGSQSKRGRRISGSNVDVPMLPPPEPVPPPRIEVEKPDANMCLKYTFGVNAWRHWVMQKNAELEKVAMTNRKIKLFKPELLQLTADELNFSLCLFVKEVRKPNGSEYAPDTIYYLCLGIQQYLFENGRIDNIFTDSYYEKFTDCLDEVAKKFAALYNDSQYIVTRVEEEHLWESKQLGAHSPHVLLSTLMFFNTKHFNLVTVEEHMQLSFSHIMKHWKRNPNAPGVAKVPGSRNVLLRFYPPQSALEANSRKKKVYEQQENEENPLRCPVKLYEFYLSKCPESVKTRNDVFYLLPERSCVPDSPVWYSTMALGKEPLTKMLHRVKMVKEINIALLTC